MTLKNIALWISILLLGLSTHALAEAPVFYVSPLGNDTWSGTQIAPTAEAKDGPFATLHRAQEALRGVDTTQGAAVYIRQGTYALEKPLLLGPEDSGTEVAPIRWQAYAKEEVRVLGGLALYYGYTESDTPLAQSLSGKLAPEQRFWQVFHNGIRMDLARWPNKGATQTSMEGWTFTDSKTSGSSDNTFSYTGDRPASWNNPAGAEVNIWPNHNWWQSIVPISKLNTQSNQITLARNLPYTIQPGRRFFFQNIVEELDAPNEWFYDRSNQTLLFIPPKGIETKSAELLIPTLKSVIQLKGTAHINIMGLTIEGTQNDGIVVQDSEHILLAKSQIRNTGGFGVRVEGGTQNRVVGCNIHNTGRGGIWLEGGDRSTLTPGSHQAVNNDIHHFGEIYSTFNNGIHLKGVAHLIRNNHIHHGPHNGILLSGNNHNIERNEIHHVAQQSTDAAAIYLSRDWTEQGNRIRHNIIHDIFGFGLEQTDNGPAYTMPNQAYGILLNDGASSTTIFGNIFYRVPEGGVRIGGGHDNSIKNNVFLDCAPALHIDNRWKGFPWQSLQEELNKFNLSGGPWQDRYPGISEYSAAPDKPVRNTFHLNVVAFSEENKTTLPKELYTLIGIDKDSTTFQANTVYHPLQTMTIDILPYEGRGVPETIFHHEWLKRNPNSNSRFLIPAFLSPDQDIYGLRRQSHPIDKLDFQPIPIHQIGLYQDEFRAPWSNERTVYPKAIVPTQFDVPTAP